MAFEQQTQADNLLAQFADTLSLSYEPILNIASAGRSILDTGTLDFGELTVVDDNTLAFEVFPSGQLLVGVNPSGITSLRLERLGEVLEIGVDLPLDLTGNFDSISINSLNAETELASFSSDLRLSVSPTDTVFDVTNIDLSFPQATLALSFEGYLNLLNDPTSWFLDSLDIKYQGNRLSLVQENLDLSVDNAGSPGAMSSTATALSFTGSNGSSFEIDLSGQPSGVLTERIVSAMSQNFSFEDTTGNRFTGRLNDELAVELDGVGTSAELSSETNTVTLIVNFLGSVMFLDGLVEPKTASSHTIEYNGTTFDYAEVDGIITTVVRDGEFTSEFAAEIAESFPDSAGISYSTAVALIGQANMESTLLMVAGADGNYVG